MLLERLIAHLGIEVEPFGTCGVADGWRLPLPAQKLVALHFTLRGRGRLVVGRATRLELGPCSLAVVPPGQPHRLEAGSGSRTGTNAPALTPGRVPHLQAGPSQDESLLVACGHLRATWAGARGVFDGLTAPLVEDFSDQPRMRQVFEAVLAEETSRRPGAATMVAALMQQCLVDLFRRLCGQDECNVSWLNALEDLRLARALRAMHGAPGRAHTLNSLAEAAAMSRSAFAVRFRDVFSQTPMDYLREVRLREAARLLPRPELSVEAVAALSGFASRSHFTRAFQRLFGVSPGAFRAAGLAARQAQSEGAN